MAHTDFRTALEGANEIEITVIGRTSGRAYSYPVWFALEGDKLYLLTDRGVLRLDMVDKSTSPLQTHVGPVFGDEAVQTGLLFPE